MRQFLLRRLGMTLLLMWLVATFIFLMIHALPGDPALVVLGGGDASPSAEQLAAVRAKLGLDVPLHQQYFNYFGNLVRGNLGASLVNGRPVALDLGLRLPRTLQLIVPTIVLSLVLGVPLGIIAARFRKSWVDPVVSGIALLGFSLPVFVVGTLLVLIFSLKLKWFPPSGWVDYTKEPLEFLRRLTLPVVALTFSPLATTMRMTRTSMLEQLHMDYVRTATAKGAVKPVIKNGLLMLSASLLTHVGVKAVFEAPANRLTLSRRIENVTNTVVMTLDSPDYTWNGTTYQTGVPAYKAGAEVMLPMRVVAPILGLGVTFNSTDRTATVQWAE